jgi:hypothetical protein
VSDDFLSGLREEPSPEFAARLRARLGEIEREERLRRLARRPVRRFLPAFAGGAFAAAVVLAFLLPPVRAAAREFLDLFRVQRFAAVPVDPERIARLQQSGLDLRAFVSEQVDVVVPASEPELLDNPEAAALAAGMPVRQPSALPPGLSLSEVQVLRPGTFRVTVDTARLEALAQAVGVEDIELPQAWNGAVIEVEAPPAVAMLYGEVGPAGYRLLQSQSPEIALPPGLDLAQLGQLGLRLAGMSPGEARRFAARLDWRTTLLVPVPLDGSQFRDVEVRGHGGLLISGRRKAHNTPDGRAVRGGWFSLLLWSEQDTLFALQGPGDGLRLLEMAESLR